MSETKQQQQQKRMARYKLHFEFIFHFIMTSFLYPAVVIYFFSQNCQIKKSQLSYFISYLQFHREKCFCNVSLFSVYVISATNPNDKNNDLVKLSRWCWWEFARDAQTCVSVFREINQERLTVPKERLNTGTWNDFNITHISCKPILKNVPFPAHAAALRHCIIPGSRRTHLLVFFHRPSS